MKVNETIFRAYDIRGKYPDQINEETAYLIGKGIGTLYPDKKIVVGWDARLSSPALKENLVKGLVETGINVIDIGMVPTPVASFACYNLGYELSLMVTGSHLTKEFNGIKVFNHKGLPIGKENGLDKVLEIIKKGEFREGEGNTNKKDISREYIDFMKKFALGFDGMKIILDGANGAAGKIYSQVLRECSAEITELYCEPDGNFPNHTPDPMNKEFIVDLEKKVKEGDYNLGFAFDSDGDRINTVDERGKIANTNHIFSLLIEEALRKNKGGKIVHDILCSKLIENIIKKRGGVPIIWKVGHMFIANKCFEENAILAGEVSGHYYFKEANYADDALLAGIKLMNILKKEGKKLSELTAKYPKYYSYSDRVNVKEDSKFKFIRGLEKKLRSQGYELTTLDGVRVNFDNGWMLFRPSNTEAKISVGFESSDKEEFEKIKKLAESIIKTIPK